MLTSLADQNLLFAVVLVRKGFIEQNQFTELLREWSKNESRGLDQIAIEKGWITDKDRDIAQGMMESFEDPQVSEATIAPPGRDTAGIGTEATHAGNRERNIGTRRVHHSATAASVSPKSNAVDATMSTGNVAPSNGPGRKDRDNGSQNGSSQDPSPPNANPNLHDFRFAWLRPHAKGGLGEVSVALDRELDREVAFKEILPRYANDSMSRERFVLEASVTGGLEHPGVVPVYGFGTKPDGNLYFAMRFIQGQTLKEAVRAYHENEADEASPEKRLAFRDLLSRFIDTCNAITYAHNRSVIHRDIKPSNIMLGKFGETLVVDWGLAKKFGRSAEPEQNQEESVILKGGGTSGTMDGSTIGTPAFMSPEQASGMIMELGPASDIYSLGSTLFFF